MSKYGLELREWALAGQSLVTSGLNIVDAHIHVGPYRSMFIPNPTADSIVRVMDRCGISKACVASHLALGPDWVRGNRYTAEAIAEFPDRLVGYAVPDPHYPSQITAELRYTFDDLAFQGLKLHPDGHSYPVDGPGYSPAWEFAAERNCPVLSHTYRGSPHCELERFDIVANRYPIVPIILLHSGALAEAFEVAIALARQHSNIYLDVSGSFMTGVWIARIVQELGAERVIFSSDVPFIDLRFSLGRVLFAPLSRAEHELVLGGNIRRLLAL